MPEANEQRESAFERKGDELLAVEENGSHTDNMDKIIASEGPNTTGGDSEFASEADSKPGVDNIQNDANNNKVLDEEVSKPIIPPKTVDEFLEMPLPHVSHIPKAERQKFLLLLSDEFKSLSRAYLEARLLRVNKLLEAIENSLKVTRSNDKTWQKLYNFEMETINNIKFNVEDIVMVDNGLETEKKNPLKSLGEYEEELREIYENLSGPLSFDESIRDKDEKSTQENNPDELAFPKLFDKIISPFKQNLKTIINENEYNTNLIFKSARGHAKIIWNQYRSNMLRKKQELIESVSGQLSQLNDEYMHLCDNKILANQWKHYYRSVVSPAEFLSHDRIRHTTYMNLDNCYHENNRIEVTDIKRRIIETARAFDYAQNRGEPGSKRVKLNSCSPLSSLEVDEDIALMKQKPSEFVPSSPESQLDDFEEEEEVSGSEEDVSFEVVNKLVEDGETLDNLNLVHDYESCSDSSEHSGNDMEDSECFNSSEEDENSEDEEDQSVKNKYKFLLGLSTGTSRERLPTALQSVPTFDFKCPALPSLEMFPPINGV